MMMRQGQLPLYRNKEGKKLYPVCSWEENQHKLFNAHDRAMNNIAEGVVDGYEELEKVERAMDAFEAHVICGLVYATYEDSKLIKDYVWAYNARH